MKLQVRAVRARLLLSAKLSDVAAVSNMAAGCSYLLAAHLLAICNGDVDAVRALLLRDTPLMRAISLHARSQLGITDSDTTYDQIVATLPTPVVEHEEA